MEFVNQTPPPAKGGHRLTFKEREEVFALADKASVGWVVFPESYNTKKEAGRAANKWNSRLKLAAGKTKKVQSVVRETDDGWKFWIRYRPES